MYITTSNQLSAIGIEGSKTSYNCPACGLSIQYAPGHQTITCDGCGHCEQLTTTYYEPMNHKVARSSFVFMSEATIVISCGNCGFQVEASNSEGSYRCPACSMEQEIDHKDGYRTKYWPDAIVPLEIPQAQAITAFENWYMASQLGINNHKEILSITPCYLPFWQVNAHGKISLLRKKRPIQIDINNQLVCSSHFRDIQLMKQSLDFDLSKSYCFDKRYLSGMTYYRYNQSSKESRDRLLQNELNRVTQRSDVIYDPKESAYSIDCELTALYLPFYIVEFKVKDQTYLSFVNGQNGHTDGERPENLIEQAAYATKNQILPVTKDIILYLWMFLGFLSFLVMGYIALNIGYIVIAYGG